MPKISNRGEEMPPSPIRKLVPFAEDAKKRGIKVYHLNIGQPDIETPPTILEAVRQSDFKVLEYSHSAGNESYRQKLTEYYARQGIEVSASEIIITTGGSEAICFAMLSCLDPGDEIIIPEPFYANYNGFAKEAGIIIKPITSSIDQAFSLPSAEAFENLITSKTKAILICNPNNPTGYLYKKEELDVLKNICLKHDLFLLSDEAYREFCYEGKHYSAMNLENMENNVLLLDTISKRYSACGGRIGAFVSKNKAVLNSAIKFAQARLSPPSFAQILGEAAVDLPANYFDSIKAAYLGRRNLMVKMLNEIPGVKCPLPGGAFYAMAALPVENADDFCQWLLEEFSVDNKTVMLAPASGFYATPGLGTNEVRLAYVLNEEDLREAIICLKEALKVYPKKR